MNLFSRLEKYRNDQEENFFTEALAGILEKDKKLCCFLIKKICEIPLEQPADIQIETQERHTAEHLRKRNKAIQLDLQIRCNNRRRLIVVENKIRSRLSVSQLRDYVQHLGNQVDRPDISIQDACLILITKRHEEKWECPDNRIQYKQLRWYDVHRFLEEFYQKHSLNSIGKEFVKYMEDKGMAIKQVTRTMCFGATQLYYFLQQLAEAMELVGLKEYKKRKAHHQEWSGFWFKSGKYDVWWGIYFPDPTILKIYIEPMHKRIISKVADAVGGKTEYFREIEGYVYIKLTDCGYFDKGVDEQMKLLEGWLTTVTKILSHRKFTR